MKKIAVIILNFNGKKDTLDCLKTIENLQFANCKLQIIVVDNASTNGSVKAIREKFSQVKLIQNKENLGFAEGNNVGIRYALKNKVDYCLILNNDTLVDKDLLLQLISCINAGKANKKIGIVAPKIYFAPGYEFHRDRYQESERGKVIWYAGGKIDWDNVLICHRGVDEVDKGQYDKKRETDFATGCCMLVKRKVFEKIGLFDKKYFLYWEDVDFCLRAEKAGFKIYFAPQAIIWHKNAGSSASGSLLHLYTPARQ